MGVALGDVDNDGLLDLFVTHLASETNTLWQQGPRGQFRDATAPLRLGYPRGTAPASARCWPTSTTTAPRPRHRQRPRHSRGTGDEPGLGFWETYAERNQLFVNDGTGKFQRSLAGQSGLVRPMERRPRTGGGDFDNDGAADLLVATIGGRARAAAQRRARTRTLAEGARLRSPDQTRRLRGRGACLRRRTRVPALIQPAESYLCSSSPLAHFGLGAAARVDGIRVTWPDGVRERFARRTADRSMELRRGEGRTP